MCHVFFIHSSVEGHLGCFWFVAIMNRAVVNKEPFFSIPLCPLGISYLWAFTCQCPEGLLTREPRPPSMLPHPQNLGSQHCIPGRKSQLQERWSWLKENWNTFFKMNFWLIFLFQEMRTSVDVCVSWVCGQHPTDVAHRLKCPRAGRQGKLGSPQGRGYRNI